MGTTQERLGKGAAASCIGWARLFGFVLLVMGMVPALLVMRGVAPQQAADMPRWFHGFLLHLLGFRVRVRGQMVDGRSAGGPVLFVCNHSSYLDIPVLGSIIDGYFVAKSEVASWPFIGTMARLQRTVFIERRAARAARQRDILRETLECGKSLILFPEGTSSDGMRTLPFKSSLFSIVEKPLPDGRPVTVQPVTILCTEINGMPIGRSWRPYYAWYGDMTLVKHVWDVFKIGAFTVDVLFHDPVQMKDFGSRKLLASHCELKIADGVNACVTGRHKKELAART